MQWNIKYYLDKCVSYSWYYRFRAAPLLQHLTKFLINRVYPATFKNYIFSPLEQLSIVLPKNSSHLWCKNYKKNIEKKLELKMLYPDNFKLDTLNKYFLHECEPILADFDSNIVIDESLNLLSILKARNLSATIAINIDECNLASSDFAVVVKEKCQKKKIDTSMIYFEISETFTLDDEKLFSGVLSLYKEGFNLSVDDFGTKLSTIQRLIELPIQEVKFDKFFLVESKKSEKGKFLFHELLQMIKSINCAIVIEGVETRDHLESVSHLDFCQLQGFYFSPGVEGKAFSKLLGEQPFAS